MQICVKLIELTLLIAIDLTIANNEINGRQQSRIRDFGSKRSEKFVKNFAISRLVDVSHFYGFAKNCGSSKRNRTLRTVVSTLTHICGQVLRRQNDHSCQRCLIPSMRRPSGRRHFHHRHCPSHRPPLLTTITRTCSDGPRSQDHQLHG